MSHCNQEVADSILQVMETTIDVIIESSVDSFVSIINVSVDLINAVLIRSTHKACHIFKHQLTDHCQFGSIAGIEITQLIGRVVIMPMLIISHLLENGSEPLDSLNRIIVQFLICI